MTMAEPADEDAIFNAIVGDMTIREPTDVESPDYTTWADIQLVEAFNKVKNRLYEMDEMPVATTPEGQDLHAKYTGLLLEMRKRNLM